MTTTATRTIVSFGTFEVDLESSELRKSGLRIKLQGQPFRVLKALLSKPGEVITREELQQEIWGVNTTVDFERGIAGAINKIREALGDSADNPRYIETLARRGFRFIAPVRLELSPAKPLSSAIAAVEVAPSPPLIPAVLPVTAEPTLSSPTPLPGVRRGRTPHRLIEVLLSGLLVITAVGWLMAWLQARTSKPSGPPQIEQLTQADSIYSGPPNPENFLSLVTDGPHIYTTVERDGRSQVASIDVSGTVIQPVSLPDDLSSVAIADISRDGRRLLVRSGSSRDPEQPLWIAPTSGVTALRLGEIVAHDATWMPDGNSVLFAVGDELRVTQLASGAISTFATLPGRAFWPRWSPDGSTLRFTLLDPTTHKSSLWEMTGQGTRPHRFDSPELAGLSLCCGSWTSDGAIYVLQASSPAGSNIWITRTGQHNRFIQLTNGPLRFLSPMPGRDDNGLYFIGQEPPGGTRFFDPARRQFLPAPSYLSQARRVSYSRDGKWLAWTDVSGRLWRTRSNDGSGRLQLSEDDLEVFMAHWAPDGHQLVMMARKPDQTWQIYTVDAGGGLPHLVLSDKRNLADPDWSADGRSIVFGREANLMGKEKGSHDLQVLDLASRQLSVLPDSEGLFSPRWSPDGRWIAALTLDQGLLRLFDTERHTWRTLFTGGVADPVWSSDGQALYFHAFASPNSAIMRVQLNGESRVVADLSEVNSPDITNYFFSGITPGGAPIIEPRVGTGNLYSINLATVH